MGIWNTLCKTETKAATAAAAAAVQLSTTVRQRWTMLSEILQLVHNA